MRTQDLSAMMRSLSADALSAKMNASADRMPLLFRFKAYAQQRKRSKSASHGSMELASLTARPVDSLSPHKETWRLKLRGRHEFLFTSNLLTPHSEFDMWKSPLIMPHDCN